MVVLFSIHYRYFDEHISGSHACHCESREGLWLQGEAALQVHSFRDTDPQPVIPPNKKKNHGISPMAPMALLDWDRNLAENINWRAQGCHTQILFDQQVYHAWYC